MSNQTLTAFEDFLEQTLATLPVGDCHRQAMRAELLGHLLCAFDDELARCGDERAAVSETLRRFGAADELRVELDACVPIWERLLSWVLGQREKIMWRLFLVLGVVAVLIGMGFVMPAVQQMLYQEVLTLSVVLLSLGTAICLGGLWSFVYGVQRFRARNV